MTDASLLLLDVESKEDLLLYVGMMAWKYERLQGGDTVQPMANCSRWGLKPSAVEARTMNYACPHMCQSNCTRVSVSGCMRCR